MSPSSHRSVDLYVSQAGKGEPVIILHGFLGSGRNWQSFGKRLAHRRHAIWPDMRNHGRSPWSEDMTYPAMAGDIIHLIERLGCENATLIGHSMGGKAAMMAALLYPQKISGLLIADIAPVGYAHDFDVILGGMDQVDFSVVESRQDVDAALKPAIPDLPTRAFVLQNLDAAAKPMRWRCNLKTFQDSMSQITGWKLPSEAMPYQSPTLFLHGGNSHYVTPDLRPQIDAWFPNAILEPIEGAGHWLHAEKPEEVWQAIASFLKL